MDKLLGFLQGGYFKGSRTKILAVLMAAQAIILWLVGDTTTSEFFNKLPEIIAGLAVWTLRDAVPAPPPEGGGG